MPALDIESVLTYNTRMEKFFELMKKQLGDDLSAFRQALLLPPVKGIRVNRLKISPREFQEISDFALSPSPFSADGFLVNYEALGKHAFHHAGLYYVQEPSASAVVEALLPYLGKKVLDLCASPGGKSTHIAAHLDAQGFLVSNETVFKRALTLASNIERMGVRNCEVTSNTPEELAKIFPCFFDTAVVDAPCSGEGMFRKNPNAIRDWSLEHVYACADRQYKILCSADKMLINGGVLAYSTCTFNTIENEGVIEKFLQTHDYTPLPIPESVACRCVESKIANAVHLYPHVSSGEGHFICLLRKNTGEVLENDYTLPYESVSKALRLQLDAFCDSFGLQLSQTQYRTRENKIYAYENLPYDRRLNLVKAGVTLCEISRSTLIPHHNLTALIPRNSHVRTVDLNADSREIACYLRGETLRIDCPFSGWGILTVNGFPLSVMKYSDGMIKNHYPKGLRNLNT